jgi:hypothetical protein
MPLFGRSENFKAPSSRVAPSKGIALTAKTFNPLAAEFIPSSPSSGAPSPPDRTIKLRRDAPEFVPSAPTSTSKLNVEAPEFVPGH